MHSKISKSIGLNIAPLVTIAAALTVVPHASIAQANDAYKSGECIDTGVIGDGWGWNGSSSCQLTGVEPKGTVQGSGVCVDTGVQGDGWGWNGTASCVVGSHVVATNNTTGPAGAVGPRGPKGDTGPRGPAGPKGRKGHTGATGPEGPKGRTGHTGPQGAAGPQGMKGDSGAQGVKGDTGAQGMKGDTGAQGMKGDTGAQGLKGDTGAQGMKGDTGAQGLKGDTGAQGLKGDTGAQGMKGETGAQGMKGEQGSPGVFDLGDIEVTPQVATGTTAYSPGTGSFQFGDRAGITSTCPGTKLLTGGGCDLTVGLVNPNWALDESGPLQSSPTVWACTYTCINTSGCGTSVSFRATAMCLGYP